MAYRPARVVVPGAFLVIAAITASAPGNAQPPAAAVTLSDAAGKEVSLTGVRFTSGVRRLGWLADPTAATPDARQGPLAVEVREPDSTAYRNGVATLIPTASVSAVRYDYDKQVMTVSVAGRPEPVAGTLKYKGINQIGLSGEAGGVPAKFTGGAAKDGFRAVAFPDPKPLPTHAPGGLAWAVRIDQPRASDPTLTVRNINALYAFPGGSEQLIGSLPIRKGDPLPLDASLQKLEVLAVDTNTRMAVFEVTTGDGPARLVAVPLTLDRDNRTGTLVGLIGEVDVGWKLFPLHTIKTLHPIDDKPEED